GAAQATRVDRRRRLLDRAHVVDGVPSAGDEFRILELDRTPDRIGRAVVATPRILDQAADGLAGTRLGPDAHHLDARDPAPLVARVVALALAEALEPLGGERAQRMRWTSGALPDRADGTDAEARGRLEPGVRAHRQGSVRRVQQVEPEEDALPARAVDFPALERGPDRVA